MWRPGMAGSDEGRCTLARPGQTHMKIDTLELLTPDTTLLADFYGAVLGLLVAMRDQMSVVIQAGYTQLVFGAAPTGWRGTYHFAFNIPENQLVAAKAWLAARVPPIRSSAGAAHPIG